MKLKMVVEWSRGSLDRFDFKKGVLVPRDPPWPPQWGVPPVNYGCIPEYFNPNDQGQLDSIWADPIPIAVGTWLEGQVLGMIRVNDLDHKIILGESLEKLPIGELEAWFEGRDMRISSTQEALDFIATLPHQ